MIIYTVSTDVCKGFLSESRDSAGRSRIDPGHPAPTPWLSYRTTLKKCSHTLLVKNAVLFFVLRGDNIDQLLYEGRVDLKMVEEARKADQIMILYTIDTAKDAFKKTV